MKNFSFLLSFVLLAGFTGCVARTVIVRSAPPPAPAPVFTETVVVAQTPPKHNPVHKNTHGTTPLIYAVSVNNVDEVRNLLKRNENPNELFYSPAYEAAPLQEAVKRGNIRAAKYLIEHGADVNLKANDKTAIEMAVLRNDLNMVVLLVSHRAYLYWPNILEYSVRERDNAVLKYLLDNGAAARNVPNARRGADYALIKACKLGNIEAMRLLIKAGANVEVIDSKGRGLLFYAAERNDVAVLEFIFPYNQRMLNTVDDDGFTPLMIAVERNNIHGAKFLVLKGAYIDVQNKKSFSVMHYSKNAEMTRFLNEEAHRHKKPAGFSMRREATSKYDDHQAKPAQKVSVIPPAQVKTEAKPSRQQPAKIEQPKVEHIKPAHEKQELKHETKPQAKPQTPKEDKRPFEQIKPDPKPNSSHNVSQPEPQPVRQNIPNRPTAVKPEQKTVEQAMPAAKAEAKATAKIEPKPDEKPVSSASKNIPNRPTAVKPEQKAAKQAMPAAKTEAKTCPHLRFPEHTLP
jgi:ankyrin repeat protein